MRAGQPGPQSAKIAGPEAKMWASGPRARSKSRPENEYEKDYKNTETSLSKMKQISDYGSISVVYRIYVLPK